MKKEQVYELCKTITPQHEIDSILFLALCEQESSYNEFAVRLEPKFLDRYISKQLEYSIPVEALLANSYGLTQMMGESLRLSGFFKWHLENNVEVSHNKYGGEMSRAHFIIALDNYVNQPTWQIEWGCIWLRKKLVLAHDNLDKAFLYWNGGSDPDYPHKIHTREERLRKELT